MEFGRDKNEQFAQELRVFLDEHYLPEWRERRFEWPFDREFHQVFTAWLGAHLSDTGPSELNALLDELDRADIDLRTTSSSALVASILNSVGTDHQKEGFLPRLNSGEFLVCLGYTEPDSGSDVAAAKTRALRDGDSWIINGQKMFTTNAEIATHVFLLTRTNIEVPKHQGLTMFLVPLSLSGVEVRPIETIRGHPTNMTYFTEVRVPDSARVGEVDHGWAVMRTALDVEHNAGSKDLLISATLVTTEFANRTGSALRRMVPWAKRATREDGTRVIDDGPTRERLARVAIDAEICRLLNGRNDQESMLPGVGNGTKLFSSESYVRASNEFMDIAGPDGLLSRAEPGSVASGWPEFTFRDAPVSTVAGGCSEVQRDIIAERRLGLPRSR
jgi:hypothetical protein